jgi:uncharacterized protein (DUF1015 family)
MAEIRPFKAVRPRKDLSEKIAALPYDVYSREEAAKKVEGDKYSFLRIDRPETQFEPTHDMYAKEVYEKAAEMLEDMQKEGSFIQDEKPCYYIYELTMDGRSQTGLVAVSAVDDYINNVIRKHENTRKEKEADRIRHVDICSAQTGPIFLAYNSNPAVKAILDDIKMSAAEADFVSDDGIRHRVWVISDDKYIDAITKEFEKMPNTYIADGHHRAASAVAVSKMRREANPDYTGDEEFNYFLSVLFDADELKIMDYNRVVKDLGGNTVEEFIEKLSEKFDIEKIGNNQYRPAKKGEIGMYINNNWYKLTVKPEYVKDDPVEGLDVAYLQREVLDPVLGIKDPSTDDRIDFVGGIRGLSELERRCSLDAKAAFAMYPTDILELFAVADAGKLMPPKSTWFEPKLRSGLFIHKI